MNDRSQMRIMIIGPAQSIHVERWINYLSSHSIKLLVVSEIPPILEVEGVEYRYLPFPRLPRLLRYGLGYFLVKRASYVFEPDAVQVHSLGTNAILALSVPRQKLIITPWGSDIAILNGRSLRRHLVQTVARRSRLILTTSEKMKIDINALFGISSAKIKVISWGINTIRFRPNQGAFEKRKERKKWDIPEDAFVFLSNRTTSITYRTSEIVEAFLDSLELRANSQLIVIGGFMPANAEAGRAQEGYKMAVAKLALKSDGRVRIINQELKSEEMASLLRAADAVVSVPKSDQRSSSVLEAIASGGQVILSDIAPNREVETDGAHVVVVKEPLKMNLASVMAKIQVIESANAASNREFIDRHESWESQAAKILQVYETIKLQ